jgi:hypothetical protein
MWLQPYVIYYFAYVIIMNLEATEFSTKMLACLSVHCFDFIFGVMFEKCVENVLTDALFYKRTFYVRCIIIIGVQFKVI